MGAMKSYEDFDHWLVDQNKGNQLLAKQVRKLVAACSLPLDESVKWGNGVWLKGDLPIAYVYAMKEGIQLGFFAGSMITDPKKILEGKGKFVRFIPITSKADIDVTYFTALLKKAIKIKYK